MQLLLPAAQGERVANDGRVEEGRLPLEVREPSSRLLHRGGHVRPASAAALPILTSFGRLPSMGEHRYFFMEMAVLWLNLMALASLARIKMFPSSRRAHLGLEKDRRGNMPGVRRTAELLEADSLPHREAALAPVVDEACGPLRGLGRQQEVLPSRRVMMTGGGKGEK